MKRQKLIRLPKSPNGTKRKTASLGCYKFQKTELRRRAINKGMTVSMYLNYLLWKEDYFDYLNKVRT